MPENIISRGLKITMYLDKGIKGEEGKHPVKLKLVYKGQIKYYETALKLSKIEFEKSYQAIKAKGKFTELKSRILEIEKNAVKISNGLKEFSFDKFEKLMFPVIDPTKTVFNYFEELEASLIKENRIKTAVNVNVSRKSFQSFLKKLGIEKNFLLFEEVTNTFLDDYEVWMLKNGKSKTTIALYVSFMRIVFNNAMDEGNVEQTIYPFGRLKRKIVKHAIEEKGLTKYELKRLNHLDLPLGSLSDECRAYWFFSYLCGGINLRDMAELKFKDLNYEECTITIHKTRTQFSKIENQQSVEMTLTYRMKEIIKSYGNRNSYSNTYVFPIFKHGIDEKEKIRLVDLWIRKINRQIKLLAKFANIQKNISTNWARYSFEKMVMENLLFLDGNSKSEKPFDVQAYIASLSRERKKELANKLLEFI